MALKPPVPAGVDTDVVLRQHMRCFEGFLLFRQLLQFLQMLHLRLFLNVQESLNILIGRL